MILVQRSKALFEKSLENAHELGNEGLEMKDGLISELHAMFIVRCHLSHLSL